MNATPATKAAAQATVRDKQANEARISGVPFFFRAISSAMTTDTPPHAISVPNSTQSKNIFGIHGERSRFPDDPEATKLVFVVFFSVLADFSGSSLS